MKKITIAIVGFLMVLSASSISYAANRNNDNLNAPARPVIVYEVHIDMSNELQLCNSYMIMITDKDGLVIAAPQPFEMGVSVYTFFEKGPVDDERIAKLVRVPSRAFVCNVRMWSDPDYQKGPFYNYNTYSFKLKPTTLAPPH